MSQLWAAYSPHQVIAIFELKSSISDPSLLRLAPFF